MVIKVEIEVSHLLNDSAILALSSKNTPVAFNHLFFWVACFLKLPVHIASEDEVVSLEVRVSPAFKNVKAFIWHRVSVSNEPVTVEVPILTGVFLEKFWTSGVSEAHACFFEEGVGFVPAFGSSEVWETRINTHSSTRSNKQGLGILD